MIALLLFFFSTLPHSAALVGLVAVLFILAVVRESLIQLIDDPADTLDNHPENS
jgi:hypothetical protein